MHCQYRIVRQINCITLCMTPKIQCDEHKTMAMVPRQPTCQDRLDYLTDHISSIKSQRKEIRVNDDDLLSMIAIK